MILLCYEKSLIALRIGSRKLSSKTASFLVAIIPACPRPPQPASCEIEPLFADLAPVVKKGVLEPPPGARNGNRQSLTGTPGSCSAVSSRHVAVAPLPILPSLRSVAAGSLGAQIALLLPDWASSRISPAIAARGWAAVVWRGTRF
jgi:hypothetical protein